MSKVPEAIEKLKGAVGTHAATAIVEFVYAFSQKNDAGLIDRVRDAIAAQNKDTLAHVATVLRESGSTDVAR